MQTLILIFCLSFVTRHLQPFIPCLASDYHDIQIRLYPVALKRHTQHVRLMQKSRLLLVKIKKKKRKNKRREQYWKTECKK